MENAARARQPQELLQWGRDHLIAEIHSRLRKPAPCSVLQWGRDHLIAEITPGPVTGTGCTCSFNGAAII